MNEQVLKLKKIQSCLLWLIQIMHLINFKGRKVYYHHIVIEHALSETFKKQAILVKCDSELLHGTNSSR